MLIRDQIEKNSGTLTQSERKLASALLSDYPFAGLITIQELAERAEVSPPSISRFVTKIGLSGYQEMQRRLIRELKGGDNSPLELHETGRRIEEGIKVKTIILNKIQLEVIQNINIVNGVLYIVGFGLIYNILCNIDI